MKKSKILIVLIIILIIFLFYEIYLYYFKDDTSNITIPTPTPTFITPIPTMPSSTIVPLDNKEEIYNGIFIKYKDNKKTFNPTVDDDNTVVLEIDGKNNNNSDIYYEIVLNTDYNPDHIINKLTFNLMELDSNDNIINHLDVGRHNTLQNQIIYVGTISGLSNINKKYKLQVTNDGSSSYNKIDVSVKISLQKPESRVKGSEIVLKTITSHPNSTWTDPTDQVIYFSGTNGVVNYNYVWYSGKLWRITAVNPDGVMKLISESIITTMSWGKNIEFNGSWVYQWLNEDFYDTLYNPSNILVTNATWNYTMDNSTIARKPESLPNQKTVVAPVGLLSSYEYYNAYRNSKNTDNYLNINHYWWNITPQHSQAVRGTDNSGRQDLYDRHPARQERGIRPVIYLNNNVEFTGDGSKNNPYRVVGDIATPKGNTLLNTRISGEYLTFDNALYRIIDIIDNKAKIVRVDYLRDGNKPIEKHIARTIYYGRASNAQIEEYWDYYLNNIWYPTISSNYRNMIVDGTYYLGSYNLNTHYKNTICQDSNLDVVKVKNCTKYNDANHVYVGKVGLVRIGEMFAAQQLDYESSPPTLWTLTPFDDVENRIVHESNTLWHHATWGGYHVVHPTLYLKDNVKISSGTGLFNSPFVISE